MWKSGTVLRASPSWSIRKTHASIVDISLADYLRQQRATEETLRLINVAPNTNDIESTSALWALRNAQRRRDSKGGSIVTTAGGNSRLVEKMGAAIGGPVMLGEPVVSIRSLDNRVEVECEDGTRLDAEFCLITVPFSVLRDISVEPGFSGLQKEAVEALPYTAITKLYFRPRHAFWEDGELARIRPSTKDALDVAGRVSWGTDPWAKGAYAHYAPRQITRLKPGMAQPWHRLHFAGEHTAITSPGLESAVESAQRAANEVIGRVS